MSDAERERTADADPDRERQDLVSALDVIEQQPLAQRAQGYAALHEELTRRLDAVGGASGRSGERP